VHPIPPPLAVGSRQPATTALTVAAARRAREGGLVLELLPHGRHGGEWRGGVDHFSCRRELATANQIRITQRLPITASVSYGRAVRLVWQLCVPRIIFQNKSIVPAPASSDAHNYLLKQFKVLRVMDQSAWRNRSANKKVDRIQNNYEASSIHLECNQPN
jgi:hypothetical protein